MRLYRRIVYDRCLRFLFHNAVAPYKLARLTRKSENILVQNSRSVLFVNFSQIILNLCGSRLPFGEYFFANFKYHNVFIFFVITTQIQVPNVKRNASLFVQLAYNGRLSVGNLWRCGHFYNCYEYELYEAHPSRLSKARRFVYAGFSFCTNAFPTKMKTCFPKRIITNALWADFPALVASLRSKYRESETRQIGSQ